MIIKNIEPLHKWTNFSAKHLILFLTGNYPFICSFCWLAEFSKLCSKTRSVCVFVPVCVCVCVCVCARGGGKCLRFRPPFFHDWLLYL